LHFKNPCQYEKVAKFQRFMADLDGASLPRRCVTLCDYRDFHLCLCSDGNVLPNSTVTEWSSTRVNFTELIDCSCMYVARYIAVILAGAG